MGSRQPVVVRVVSPHGRSSGGQGGINCCCCRCCSCLHFDVLTTSPAKCKIVEAILAGAIQSLLLRFGHGQAGAIGFSYDACLTTSSACLLTPIILLIAYVISPHCVGTLRSTPFELLFNGLASAIYLASGGYLAFSVSVFLWPLYIAQPFFQAYPALTACYVMSFLASITHGIDAYMSYKQYRGIS